MLLVLMFSLCHDTQWAVSSQTPQNHARPCLAHSYSFISFIHRKGVGRTKPAVTGNLGGVPSHWLDRTCYSNKPFLSYNSQCFLATVASTAAT